MKAILLAVATTLLLAGSSGPLQSGGAPSPQELLPADLDRLLAPIALYPDQLLAQILLCSTDPVSVKALDDFLRDNATLKGTALQDAAVTKGFEPSFVALALFPQVVKQMVASLAQTTDLGKAFTTNRSAVFESIQRLRAQAQKAGTLKSTPQQEVEQQTTSTGQQVIVIEPTNPQVIYVPQYNPTVVYTQPTTVIVEKESSSTDAAVAGLIGFTAGIAIGAAIDNDYYYGPYGWHGGAYMYNDAWDDYYDHREDAREDWQDHREDLADERGDRSRTAQEQRTERTEARQDGTRAGTTATGTRAGTTATGTRSGTTAAGTREGAAATGTRSGTTSTAATSAGASTYGARGHTQSTERAKTTTAKERSGTGSNAFSGYSSGKSERAASSRGQSSRSSSRSRSGGGGGRRR